MAKMQRLVMPKLGLTMTEGTVVEWSVEEGAAFDAGKLVVVIETDKVANEIEAPAAGRLIRILVPASETVAVGTPLAEWELQDDSILGQAARVETAPAAALSRRAPSTTEVATARRMVESKQEIPHFYLSVAIDVSVLAVRRANWNACHPDQKATITHVLMFALANALKAIPDLNRVWVSEGEIAGLPTIDIGLAIDTPDGLRAPVLRDLADSSLPELIKALDDVKQRALSNRLTSQDMGGGAITLSNSGALGVDSMTSIIIPGQAMILGVGRERPVVRLDEGGRVVAAREITATLSCDHRVIDGSAGARLLREIRKILEKPVAIFGD